MYDDHIGELFPRLSPQHRAQLAREARARRIVAGATIYSVGDLAESLWLILDGEVTLSSEFDGTERILAHLGVGEVLGALSALDDENRALSASASTSGAVLLELPLSSIARLEEVPRAHVHAVLGEHVSRTARQKAHQLSALLVKRSQEVAFMLVCFAVLSMTVMAAGVLTQLFEMMASTTYVLLIYLVGLFFFLGYFLLRVRPPLATLGLTPRKFARGLGEGAALAIVVVSVMTGIKALAITHVEAWSHLPLIDALNLEGSRDRALAERWRILLWTVLGYGFAGFLQEFVARGILQGQLEAIFEEREVPWRAILVSNLVFAAVHAVWSIQLMVLSFCGGMLWGWLYWRNRSIYSVGLSHSLVGIWCLKVLNIPALYHIWPF